MIALGIGNGHSCPFPALAKKDCSAAQSDSALRNKGSKHVSNVKIKHDKLEAYSLQRPSFA